MMWKGTWLIVAGAFAVDLCSKWLAVLWLSKPPGTYSVLPIFSLTLVYNPGMSFGLFGASTATQSWSLSGIGIAIVALLMWMTIRSTDRWEQSGYALIIGGAIGNVLDRLHDGFVTDFLDFHLGAWRYPTFNLADTAITIGVGILLVRSLTIQRAHPQG